jgi:MipA family protein
MKIVIVGIISITFAMSSYAYDIPEKNWGISIGIRNATIPFRTEEKSVQDVVPLIYYDGDLLFIRGLSAGIKLYRNDAWQFNLVGQYRFFDIPSEYQNRVQGNAFDIGGQLKYRFNNNLEANFEALSDQHNRSYISLNTRYHWKSGSWELFPYANLRFKGASFNDHYYGLDGFNDPGNPFNTLDNKIGSAFDMTMGSELRYHVTSNFYLLGRAQYTALDSKTRNSISIEDGSYGELYLGIAFFNDITNSKVSSLKAKPYIRVAQGWASPSSLGEIVGLNVEEDPQNNQFTSIFYGYPVADSLFGIEALDIYLTTGYVYHHSSDPYSQTLTPGEGINTPDSVGLGSNPCDGVNPCTITYDKQPTSEYVLGIKAYYNMYWPVHWRFGLAEGLSYIETVSNIEQREMDKKGYRSSRFMNYIDVTVDFSLGDTFGFDALNEIYLGAGIHHRSSIFESSSAFGRVKGGSNYPSLYLQYHW